MIKTLLLLSIATGAAQPPLSYDDAKQHADRDEATLATDRTRALLAAQGDSIRTGLQACASRVGHPPKTVGIVLELDVDGRVKNAWSRGSAFDECFRDSFKATFRFTPPHAGFYTSVILNF
jgi:hypothetical protein